MLRHHLGATFPMKSREDSIGSGRQTTQTTPLKQAQNRALVLSGRCLHAETTGQLQTTETIHMKLLSSTGAIHVEMLYLQ